MRYMRKRYTQLLEEEEEEDFIPKRKSREGG
jgi:hypothetical protein